MRLRDFFVYPGLSRAMLLSAVCAIFVLHGPARAQFFDPNLVGAAMTVEEARTAPVQTRVALTGSLLNEVMRAHYMFRDATGDIRVRIESEIWGGRQITSNKTLDLRGRVETDVRGRFIDVYYFKVLD